MSGLSRRSFVTVAAGGVATCVFPFRFAAAQSEIPSGAIEATFVSAPDGEKMKVMISGESQEVRLIGVDAPEMDLGDDKTECFSNESRDFLVAQLSGQSVFLVSDVEDKDGKGRLWRYVWAYIDGVPVFLNEYLLANGYAIGQAEEKNVAHQKELDTAAKAAQQAKVGLWGTCTSGHQKVPRHGSADDPGVLGERLVGSGMAVTLQSAYATYQYGFSSPRGGYKFLVIELYLENVTDGEQKGYSSSRVKAKDNQTGATFKDIYDPTDSPLGTGELSPGSYIYGVIGIEVQETSTDLRVEYGVNALGGATLYWNVQV